MATLAAIRSILIPTDFSDEARIAFAHALRLAVALKAELDILHAEPENDQPDWEWGPHVRDTLIRWGYLPEGAPVEALEGLGIRVRKSLIVGKSPDQAIIEEVVNSHADLVVLATHGRSGVRRWLEPSVTTPVALKGAVPVLFIPHNHKGFVDPTTGGPTLNRVLIPVDNKPHPAPAFDAANIVARALPGEHLYLATLHVGGGQVETEWIKPLPHWSTLHWNATGSVVENILETARTWSADLIVCVSEGRHGLLDALRGSTVERLLSQVHTPLLIVPNEWGTDQVGTSNVI